MPIKISCPHCGAEILNTLESYADHIFKKHSDNLELCEWARLELAKISKTPKDIIPKYMGRPIDRIPPARVKKIIKGLDNSNKKGGDKRK